MLVVLIDCSGSMGDRFQGGLSLEGRKRIAVDTLKFDAARRALLDHLPGVSQTEALVVVAFESTSTEVFRGSSRERARLEAVLGTLRPGGGTDIPHALQHAHAILDADPRRGPSKVLVISDGLSDNDAIEPAVDAITMLGCPIDVTLIDPTVDGTAKARRIAVHGYFFPVEAPVAVDSAIASSVQAHAAHAERFRKISAALDREVEKLREARSAREDVQFTTIYPSIVVPAAWNALRIIVHLERLTDEVRRSVSAALEAISHSQVTRIARGTRIRIEPHLPDLELDVGAVDLIWHDDIQEATVRFRVPATAAAARYSGFIDISIDGSLVAELALAIRVVPTLPQDHEPVVTATGLFERVFVSYSTIDLAVVEACVQTYRALGIHVLIDRSILHGGDDLEQALGDAIERADLFQLYWSTNAVDSRWVETEWKHALALTGPRSRKGPNFIRPLTWEPCPPELPGPLKHLRFEQLDRSKLALAGVEPSPAPRLATAPAAAYALVERVPSPLDGVQLRERIADVVGFLHGELGLPYQPVLTEVVDEHMLVESATECTTHPSSPDDGLDTARAAVELLRTIMVTLHIRIGALQRDGIHDVADLSADALAIVKRDLEGMAQALTQLIDPGWLAVRDRFGARAPRLRDASETDTVTWALNAHASLCDASTIVYGNEGMFDKADLEAGRAVSGDRVDQATQAARRASASHGAPSAGPLGALLRRAAEEYAMGRTARAVPLIKIARVPRLEFPVAPVQGFDRVMLDADDAGLLASRRWLPCHPLLWLLMRDRWAALQLCPHDADRDQFLRAVRDTMARLLPACLASPCDRTSVDVASEHRARIELLVRDQLAIDEKRHLQGPAERFAAAAQVAWNVVQTFLGDPLARRRGRQRWSTYGVFLAAGPAVATTPIRITPGTAKVLLCDSAIGRRADHDGCEMQSLATCTLVHEHVHAAIWELRAQMRRPGQEPALAVAIEEAIAAWAEQRFAARSQDSRILGAIADYIASGRWPEWAYQGAELIEHQVKREGLAVVRALIGSLTRSPDVAIATFRAWADQFARDLDLPPAASTAGARTAGLPATR